MIQKPLVSKGGLGNLGRHLLAIVITLILFPLLIVINVVQTLSLVILPFSRRAFRRFNCFCGFVWWGLCVLFSKKIHGVQMVMSGDDVPPEENAILISNHQSMVDVLSLFFLGIDKHRLGDMKWFAKDVLKYVPGAGWGMWFLDFIFLKRNWESDEVYIQQSFSKFKEYNIPIWLVSFLEGTRITPLKWQQSQAYALKAGIEAPQNVLVPRTKGFAASIKGLRSHIDAVYDITLAYPDGAPSLWQYTKGEVPRVHFRVKRYEMIKMPESPAGLAEWVMERYREKDRLLSYFLEHGQFPAAEAKLLY